MEIRVDRRSNTGGSLLPILLNRNDSPKHWVQYPVSHERTQLTHIQWRLHTRAGLILMPPRHVHTTHLMQIHCLTYKHTTGLDVL